MLDIIASFDLGGYVLPAFGTVDEISQAIELSYEMKFLSPEQIKENPFCFKRINLQVLDKEARSFTVYGCIFSWRGLTLTSSGIETLKGKFERLVRENKPNAVYHSVEFTFEGITKYFPLEKFESAHSPDLNKLVFIKEAGGTELKANLYQDVQICVQSKYEGAFESDTLYDLSIHQKKVIMLTADEPRSIDIWLSYIRKIKHFFEFGNQFKIAISGISFDQVPRTAKSEALLVSDPILLPVINKKRIDEFHLLGSESEILKGLSNWFKVYDKYAQVFEIWQKIIYNSDVSEDDKFLWKCQAFELLCTLNENIYKKACALKTGKNSDPNIKNFLMAVDEVYNLPNWGAQFYIDTKEARNIVTHHNPQKSLSEQSYKNAMQMINGYLTRTVAEIVGYKYLDRGMLLITK